MSEISRNLWRGQTIRLTAVTKDDLPGIARWYQDAGFLRLWNADAAKPQTEADLAKWLEEGARKENTFAFRELNLHKVQLTAFAYNERALALYEKLGFIREGTYREFLLRDGRRYDMYLYGLLRREWAAATPATTCAQIPQE